MVAAQKLDARTFDDLLREQNPFESADPVFDLEQIRLVTPAAMVQLAAACHSLAQLGRAASLRIDDDGVRSYLVRAGFVDAIEDVATIIPPIASGNLYRLRQGMSPMLIELTTLRSGASLPNLLEKIVWVLRHRLKYRKHDAFDAVTAISEIAQNTFDHNSAAVGFLAMQVYGKGVGRFLEIGVGDCGDGLATTLRRNPKNPAIQSDREAIQMAIRQGTSEHDDPTRGTGLYHLLDITYKHKGGVQIRSGDAKIYYRMDRRQGYSFTVPSMRGVQIALTLRTKAAVAA